MAQEITCTHTIYALGELSQEAQQRAHQDFRAKSGPALRSLSVGLPRELQYSNSFRYFAGASDAHEWTYLADGRLFSGC